MQRGSYRVSHEEDREKRRATPKTDAKQVSGQRARRLTLRPIAVTSMPTRTAIGGNTGSPVCANRAVVVGGAGGADGVGVALAAAVGQAAGSVPDTGLTGRKVEASPISDWVVDKASGTAVALEPGREYPNPPFSYWKLRRSVSPFL